MLAVSLSVPAPVSLCHVSLYAIVVRVFYLLFSTTNEVESVARIPTEYGIQIKSTTLSLSSMREAHSTVAASHYPGQGLANQV